MTGPVVTAAIGAEGTRAPFSALAEITYSWGTTTDGLTAHYGALEIDLSWTPGRLRLGGGIGFAYLGFTRATRDETLDKLGFGGHLTASFDVMRIGDTSALYVAARPSGDVSGAHGLWGGVLGAAGARF